jgi:hypothetical protein
MGKNLDDETTDLIKDMESKVLAAAIEPLTRQEQILLMMAKSLIILADKIGKRLP